MEKETTATGPGGVRGRQGGMRDGAGEVRGGARDNAGEVRGGAGGAGREAACRAGSLPSACTVPDLADLLSFGLRRPDDQRATCGSGRPAIRGRPAICRPVIGRGDDDSKWRRLAASQCVLAAINTAAYFGYAFTKLFLTKDNLAVTLREWNKPPPTVSPRFTRPCTGRLPRGLCRVLGRFPLRVPPASKSPRSMIPLSACSVPFGFRCPLPNEVFFRDLGGAFSCDSP